MARFCHPHPQFLPSFDIRIHPYPLDLLSVSIHIRKMTVRYPSVSIHRESPSFVSESFCLQSDFYFMSMFRLFIDSKWVATGKLLNNENVGGKTSIHCREYDGSEYMAIILQECNKDCEAYALPVGIDDDISLGEACKFHYIVPWPIKYTKKASESRMFEMASMAKNHESVSRNKRKASEPVKELVLQEDEDDHIVGKKSDVQMTDLSRNNELTCEDVTAISPPPKKLSKEELEEKALKVFTEGHYVRKSKTHVKCTICGKDFSFTLGQKMTGNLWSHKASHSKDLNQRDISKMMIPEKLPSQV